MLKEVAGRLGLSEFTNETKEKHPGETGMLRIFVEVLTTL